MRARENLARARTCTIESYVEDRRNRGRPREKLQPTPSPSSYELARGGELTRTHRLSSPANPFVLSAVYWALPRGTARDPRRRFVLRFRKGVVSVATVLDWRFIFLCFATCISLLVSLLILFSPSLNCCQLPWSASGTWSLGLLAWLTQLRMAPLRLYPCSASAVSSSHMIIHTSAQATASTTQSSIQTVPSFHLINRPPTSSIRHIFI